VYKTLEEADAAVERIARLMTYETPDMQIVVMGVDAKDSRRLCAIGAGYADWHDLEMRVGTAEAAPTPTPEESMNLLAPILIEERISDHPLAVEAQLSPTQAVIADPAGWMRQTLDLAHVVQEDIGRLEAAESMFDYVRLSSDPAIGDMELTKLISLKLGMDMDVEQLRRIDGEMLSWKGEGGRRQTMKELSRHQPRGDDDSTRMALCGRASRIDDLVENMGAAELAGVLATVARFVSAAGGAVSASHMLVRLAVLRPPRGTWRDAFRDMIDPDSMTDDD
jgi:hypothetical protein